MDDAHYIHDYLPASYSAPEERDYITFLWDTFVMNYEHGRYQFAFLAYHMLAMSYVYFTIWRIRHVRLPSVEIGLIGLERDEGTLLKAKSPFEFSKIGERTILRFLRIIDCDNGKIGAYIRLVKDRNDIAHANGHIYFRSKEALDDRILEVLRVVREIYDHARPVVEHCYQDFLVEYADPESWEYLDAADQIQNLLIQRHYLSPNDIKVCLAWNVADQEPLAASDAVEGLHNALLETYHAIAGVCAVG